MITLLTGSVWAKPEIWRDPSVFRINKEPAHAEFIEYTSRQDALKPLDLENPWSSSVYQSLNGQWDFNWYANLDDIPADWNQLETKVSKWNKIPVPGSWQTYGYDRLYYINFPLPFFFDYEKGGAPREEFRGKAKEKNTAIGFVPKDVVSVGCYRKWLDVSSEQLTKRVILRIGAVEAGVSVYVNGTEQPYPGRV